MLAYLQSFNAIILGIVSSRTDFKEMKIYNKNIKRFLLISCIIYVLFFKQIEFMFIKEHTINLTVSILISFLLFYFKIWAAGDAKLFIAIVFMIPYSIYGNNPKNIFPAIYLLIMIFSSAFIYVVIESFYLWIKDKEKIKRINLSKYDKDNLKNFILSYLLGYSITLFINNILYSFLENFKIYNGSLIMLCNMLMLIFIYQVITDPPAIKKATIIFVILNIVYYAIFGIEIQIFNIKMFVIVLIIMLFRNISSKYNYETINVSDLKARMILSFGSVIQFYGSNVKGLPKSTTESTDSRLTEDEVSSIKRWSKTKRGKDEITIVKHLPFAPFILIGEIIFFVIKLYS